MTQNNEWTEIPYYDRLMFMHKNTIKFCIGNDQQLNMKQEECEKYEITQKNELPVTINWSNSITQIIEYDNNWASIHQLIDLSKGIVVTKESRQLMLNNPKQYILDINCEHICKIEIHYILSETKKHAIGCQFTVFNNKTNEFQTFPPEFRPQLEQAYTDTYESVKHQELMMNLAQNIEIYSYKITKKLNELFMNIHHIESSSSSSSSQDISDMDGIVKIEYDINGFVSIEYKSGKKYMQQEYGTTIYCIETQPELVSAVSYNVQKKEFAFIYDNQVIPGRFANNWEKNKLKIVYIDKNYDIEGHILGISDTQILSTENSLYVDKNNCQNICSQYYPDSFYCFPVVTNNDMTIKLHKENSDIIMTSYGELLFHIEEFENQLHEFKSSSYIDVQMIAGEEFEIIKINNNIYNILDDFSVDSECLDVVPDNEELNCTGQYCCTSYTNNGFMQINLSQLPKEYFIALSSYYCPYELFDMFKSDIIATDNKSIEIYVQNHQYMCNNSENEQNRCNDTDIHDKYIVRNDEPKHILYNSNRSTIAILSEHDMQIIHAKHTSEDHDPYKSEVFGLINDTFLDNYEIIYSHKPDPEFICIDYSRMKNHDHCKLIKIVSDITETICFFPYSVEESGESGREFLCRNSNISLQKNKEYNILIYNFNKLLHKYPDFTLESTYNLQIEFDQTIYIDDDFMDNLHRLINIDSDYYFCGIDTKIEFNNNKLLDVSSNLLQDQTYISEILETFDLVKKNDSNIIKIPLNINIGTQIIHIVNSVFCSNIYSYIDLKHHADNIFDSAQMQIQTINDVDYLHVMMKEKSETKICRTMIEKHYKNQIEFAINHGKILALFVLEPDSQINTDSDIIAIISYDVDSFIDQESLTDHIDTLDRHVMNCNSYIEKQISEGTNDCFQLLQSIIPYDLSDLRSLNAMMPINVENMICPIEYMDNQISDMNMQDSSDMQFDPNDTYVQRIIKEICSEQYNKEYFMKIILKDNNRYENTARLLLKYMDQINVGDQWNIYSCEYNYVMINSESSFADYIRCIYPSIISHRYYKILSENHPTECNISAGNQLIQFITDNNLQQLMIDLSMIHMHVPDKNILIALSYKLGSKKEKIIKELSENQEINMNSLSFYSIQQFIEYLHMLPRKTLDKILDEMNQMEQ